MIGLIKRQVYVRLFLIKINQDVKSYNKSLQLNFLLSQKIN